jgi:DNA-binding NarL/FixJ family response regulator
MRILLADDHSLVRDALKPYLEGLAESVEIIEAGSLPEVIAHAANGASPELVLLDLHMPGMNGPRSIATVRERYPNASVVILSGYADRATITAALNEGARGYVPKTARGKSLVTALKLVLDGEIYLPPALIGEGGGLPAAEAPQSSAEIPASGPLAKLSPRESSILRLLIAGKTNKEIARDLDLQEITVKVHLRNVYRKIEASNRADAVRIAMMQGWS